VDGDADVKGDAVKEKKPRSSEHTEEAGSASTRKLQLVTVHGKPVPAGKFATLLCDAGGLVNGTDRDRAAAKGDVFLLFPYARANCEYTHGVTHGCCHFRESRCVHCGVHRASARVLAVRRCYAIGTSGVGLLRLKGPRLKPMSAFVSQAPPLRSPVCRGRRPSCCGVSCRARRIRRTRSWTRSW
jgi:hypothetical protein